AALAREASSGERGANKAEPGQAAPPETAVPPQSAEQPPTLETPIEDILDLHEFSPRQSGELVETYLAEACAKGFSSVRIIHGKGTGAQRERVRKILSRTPFVERYGDAPAEAGGWGATIVWFRPNAE